MILNINNIIRVLDAEIIQKGVKTSFEELFFDSRKVKKGSIFIAVSGTNADGHDFVDQVVEKGASLIIIEKDIDNYSEGITYLKVKNTSIALAQLASEFYGNPSEKINLVGVTGTNGKTTIVTLLYNLIEELGFKAGLLSTVRNYIHKKEIKATHTTPDPLQINKLLSEMIDEGCEYCFMEVSSHAMAQSRIEALNFNGAVFTNITHDHLDYHKTFQNYIKAKKAFFDGLDNNAFALVNSDDKNSAVMVQNSPAGKKTYSMKNISDYRVRIEEKHFEGMQLFINDNEVWSPLIGDFNAYNLLAVYAVADLLGLPQTDVLIALSKLSPAEGRLETIKKEGKPTVIVDYAHTPDALENILKTLLDSKPEKSEIIIVFGAGGNRDKTKRPEMGKIASLYSNKIVLTSDNPRDEKPEQIITEIENGIKNDKVDVLKVSDRKEAIKVALSLAKPQDMVVIAGKGHETYQEINGVKSHFDDREIVRNSFKN